MQTTEPTKDEITRAAHKWAGSKERETFYEDILYFSYNWSHLPGLKAYVDREVALREGAEAPRD